MPPDDDRPVFKLGERGPQLVREVLESRGWREYDEDADGDRWDLFWRSGRFTMAEYAMASMQKRMNHLPKTTGITKKDALLRNLRRMRNLHGSVFNFFPDTFILPTEYASMVRWVDGLTEADRPIWIVKPTDSSQGRKIFLIRDVHEISYGHVVGDGALGGGDFEPAARKTDAEETQQLKGYMSWRLQPELDDRGRAIASDSDISLTLKMLKSRLQRTVTPCARFTEMHIAQVYVDRPFCVSGYKLDLRLYVLVASVRPLRVYLYRDCLLRFATQQYDLNDLQNAFSHLTNSSINKHSDSLDHDKAGIGAGCKFSFEAWVRRHPDSQLASPLLWARIRAIVCLTLLSIACQVPDSVGCFELLGYDIIVDQSLKPWLLEVNTSPALSIECEADSQVKRGLISDLADLLALQRPQAPAAKADRDTNTARARSAGAGVVRLGARAPAAGGGKASGLEGGGSDGRRTVAGGGVAAVRSRGRSAPRISRISRVGGEPAAPPLPEAVGGYQLIFPLNRASAALLDDGAAGNEAAIVAQVKAELHRARAAADGGAAAAAAAGGEAAQATTGGDHIAPEEAGAPAGESGARGGGAGASSDDAGGRAGCQGRSSAVSAKEAGRPLHLPADMLGGEVKPAPGVVGVTRACTGAVAGVLAGLESS